MNAFGTAGIRGPVGETVTPSFAMSVGRAVAADVASADVATSDDRPGVVVGHDGRVTSPTLANALVAGLTSGGVDVARVGWVPTPALAFASRRRRGVMITASHNPPADNGIKCFVDGQEYDRDAEVAIESRLDEDLEAATWDAWGRDSGLDVLERYRVAVAAYAAGHGADPANIRVAVDCGNGMAGLATPQVLRTLGTDVCALEANVDGHFPARDSKPTPESLTALRSFVGRTDADLGIAHDGDADRIVVVDGAGEVVHEDTVLAIFAEHYVRQSSVGDPVVVTTPNASGRIDERVDAAGGRVERVRLGALHEGIAASDGDVVFAAEPWKHIHPAFGPWIDGVVSAALVTRLVAADGLAALRDPITERPYRKTSVGCPDGAKEAAVADLETTLPEAFPEAVVSTAHGVRLTFPDDAWTLVRPSGTEPKVRIYAEHDDVEDFVERVRDVVERTVDARRD